MGHAARDTQEQILAFLERYIGEVGYPPLVNEIADEIGRDRKTVQRHLRAMDEDGIITLGQGPRAIAIGGFVSNKKPRKKTREEHQSEAEARLDVIMPGLAPEVRTKLAEAVAGSEMRRAGT